MCLYTGPVKGGLAVHQQHVTITQVPADSFRPATQLFARLVCDEGSSEGLSLGEVSGGEQGHHSRLRHDMCRTERMQRYSELL
mgnify:CR=1 FL=1